MDSGKVTAIATSVIAISILGFAFSGIRNDPKNVKERCTAKHAKKLSNRPSDVEDIIWINIIMNQYNECLGYKGDSWDLYGYINDNL